MGLELRPYQIEAIDAIYNYFSENGGNPVVSLPTGSGKSVVIAEFIRRSITEWPDTNIIVLSHVAELLSQNLNELLTIWPDAPAGLYSAGLGKRDLRSKIIFAGIQSIHRRAYDLNRVDLVLIDECHLVSDKSNAMYRKLLKTLLRINGHTHVIGFSATPFRLGSGLLTEGEGALFTDIVYEADLLKLIEDGYLAPLVCKGTVTRLDTSGVGVRNGEFIASELEAAVNIDSISRAAVNEIVAFGADRRSWVVFCSGVSHAHAVAGIIREHGITCGTITGKTPKNERAAMLRDFTNGRIRCLTNANVLTTGINVRAIDLIAFMRPTKSTSLYIQMAGRAMRLSPETGKQNGLVLDFAGLVKEHGPVDKAKPRPKGSGPAPTKECPSCNSIVFAGLRVCPDCGHEWEFVEQGPKIKPVADVLPVLSSEKPPAAEPEWLEVQQVYYRRHEKAGKPPSLLVEYVVGLTSSHKEWICVSHDGYPRQKAIAWWRRRAPEVPVPDTVEEALANVGALKVPTHICIRPSGKYTEIVGARLP